jgi:hypothetical protein
MWLMAKVLLQRTNGKGRGISADAGKLLTAWARKINADHAADPLCHAGSRGETIHAFLRHTDFGEIREMVEGSGHCVLKTVEAFNEQLWKYPAKVGSLLGTLLAVVNTAIKSAATLLKPIERKVGPDLLADLLLSLVRGIDAREAAGLVNSVHEFIRRLHTGNLLLAKAGKPLFQGYLTSLLEEGLPQIDPVLLKKARVALAEDREAIANALADVLRDNPGLVLEMVSAYGSLKTPLIRAFSRRAGLYDELDPEALAGAISLGLSDLDTYEISQAVNTLVRLLNNLHEIKPDMFSSFLTSIVDSLNAEEIRTATAWIVPEIVEAARPFLDAVMPATKSGLRRAGGE